MFEKGTFSKRKTFFDNRFWQMLEFIRKMLFTFFVNFLSSYAHSAALLSIIMLSSEPISSSFWRCQDLKDHNSVVSCLLSSLGQGFDSKFDTFKTHLPSIIILHTLPSSYIDPCRSIPLIKNWRPIYKSWFHCHI